MKTQGLDEFIEAWGRIGGLLGFNPSTARVHALLIASAEALSLDEMAERLGISRGNASMCLKELRAWGVVQRTRRPGERREYYSSERDVWKMAIAIGRERKRRDFDPTLKGLHDAITILSNDPQGVEIERLRQMEGFLSTLDDLATRLLENDETVLSLVTLMTGISTSGAK